MRKATVFVNKHKAGELQEIERRKHYRFIYDSSYKGPSVSLTMPVTEQVYDFDRFPPFFEGLLPEGFMLEALLRQKKLDQSDLMGQLLTVGLDLVGDVTIKEAS